MYCVYFVIGLSLLVKNRKHLSKKLKDKWNKFAKEFVSSDDKNDKKPDMSIGGNKNQDKYKNL